MILHKLFGQHLRLGNFLYKLSAMWAMTYRYNCKMKLPDYFLWKYLVNPPEIDNGEIVEDVFRTRKWEFDPLHLHDHAELFRTKNVDIDLGAFFQSARWFEDFEPEILEKLKFKQEYVDFCKEKYKDSLSKETIAISIRRGDMVNHNSFFQIPIEYYLIALQEEFPNWKEYNIVFFSDDIEWCKQTFKGDNVYFAEPNGTHITIYDSNNYHKDPTEQLIYGTLCDNFIIGQSTFSWWQAFLGSKRSGGKVVHSGKNFDNDYSHYDIRDYYYPIWVKVDYLDEHGNLKKLTDETKSLLK